MTYHRNYAPLVVHYNGLPVARGYWRKAKKSRVITKRRLKTQPSRLVIYASLIFILASMYRSFVWSQEVHSDNQGQITMAKGDPLSIYKVEDIKLNFDLKPSIYDQTFPANIHHVPDIIRRVSRDFGIHDRLPLAIASCESNFNPLAKNKSSSATGVFQFIRDTWASTPEGQAGHKPTETLPNITAGVRKIADGELSPWSSSYHCWIKKI